MTKYFDLHAPLQAPYDWHVTTPDSMNIRDAIAAVERRNVTVMWGRQVHRAEPLHFQTAVDLTTGEYVAPPEHEDGVLEIFDEPAMVQA